MAKNAKGESQDFHALRHTCLAWLMLAGVAIKTACGQKTPPTRKLRLQADLKTRFGPLVGGRLRSSIPVRPAQTVPFGPSSGRSLGHSHSPRLSLAPS